MFPLGLHNYIEIIGFLISLLCWSRLKHSSLKWIMPYFLFIVLVELSGRYIGRDLGNSVGWLYNFSVPVEYMFFSFLYYEHYATPAYKKLAMLFLILFPVFVIIYSLIYSNYNFHTVYLKIGSFIMIAFSCLYLADLLRSDVAFNPLRQPMLWIASGVLLFNAGEFISNFLMDILFEDMSRWREIFGLVNNNLIVVLYSCIATGILLETWDRRETT